MPKVRMGLITADEQIPFHLRDHNGMGAVEKYIVDAKPDIRVRLGDMLDMNALQGWTRMSPEGVEWDEIRDEIAIANDMMDRQDAKLPAHCEKHFWMGNHEERLMKFRHKNRFSAYWIKNKTTIPYLIRDLKLKERGYKVHPQNDAHPFGKLYMFHGDNYSTWHTQKNVLAYEANLVYGHVHSPQRFTKVGRIDKSPKSAWSIGCLCSTNPEWKNGGPNAWVSGFAIFYLQDNGLFNLYPVDMSKGSFVAPNGKLYK